MEDVKQVVVVRKDLNMRKAKMAEVVAHASMGFLVDNNEADRGDEVIIRLTPAEAMWLSGSSQLTDVLSIDSEEALQDLIFRAQLFDIEVCPVGDGDEDLACAAFGPCSSEQLDRITGNLKPV